MTPVWLSQSAVFWGPERARRIDKFRNADHTR